MAYISEMMLRAYAYTDWMTKTAGEHVRKSPEQASTSIFLSHSHDDASLARGLVNYFGTLGLSIYIDWNDSNMPRITSGATASKIKDKIKECYNFMVLATDNAMISRWVPWEIGVADVEKGADKITIIPVASMYDGTFKGNEYLQLYRRMVISDSDQIAVFNPNQTRGELVKDFLR